MPVLDEPEVVAAPQVADRRAPASAPMAAPASYRPFLKSLYLIGLLVVFFALVQPLLQVWPPRPGEARWRFGAVGIYSSGVVTTLLGLAWIMAVAALLRHRRTLRVLGLLCMVGAVALLAMLLVFALDALQLRTVVNPGARPAFDVSVLRAALVLAVSIPVTFLIGIAARRSTRRGARTRSPGIVYRTQAEAEEGKPGAAGHSA